jgi:hypothetical protein
MASIDWPAELPKTILLAGLLAKQKSNVIRTAMDAGPQKSRRRYTASTKTFTGKMLLTAYQRDVLEYFYHQDLYDGVLRFRFINPQTLEIEEFRFTDNYTEVSVDGLYEISLALERL